MTDVGAAYQPSESALQQARASVLLPAIRKSMLSSGLSIAVFGALLVAYSTRGFVIWLTLRVLASGAILAVLAKLAKTERDSDTTIKALALLMAASGVVWGLIPMLIRPEAPEWRAVIVVWLFGNQSVVTAVCSASKPVFRAASGSVTIVGGLSILLYGDSFGLVLALLVLLGGVYSVSIFGAMHGSVNTAIEGRLTAAALATSLGKQQAELEAANSTLVHLANHDELTNLLNRRSFGNLVAKDQGQVRSAGWLVNLDIDYFKDINDTHGHAAGDSVLCIAARRWQSALPQDGLLSRTGGDEFAAWFSAETASDARAVAERLNHCLTGPIALGQGVIVKLSCSVGFTHVHLGEPYSTASARADRALYMAKARGRNSVEHAAPDLTEEEPVESAGSASAGDRTPTSEDTDHAAGRRL